MKGKMSAKDTNIIAPAILPFLPFVFVLSLCLLRAVSLVIRLLKRQYPPSDFDRQRLGQYGPIVGNEAAYDDESEGEEESRSFLPERRTFAAHQYQTPIRVEKMDTLMTRTIIFLSIAFKLALLIWSYFDRNQSIGNAAVHILVPIATWVIVGILFIVNTKDSGLLSVYALILITEGLAYYHLIDTPDTSRPIFWITAQHRELIGLVFSTIIFLTDSLCTILAKIQEIPLPTPLPCAEKHASLWSRLTFSWITDMMVLGTLRPLEESDVADLMEEDKSDHILKRYYAIKRKSKKQTSLFWNLVLLIRKLMVFQMLCALMCAVLAFSGPFFLNRIVTIIQSPDRDYRTGWFYLIALFCASVTKAIFDGQMYFTGRRNGNHIRAVLIGEIYAKSLRRSAVPATVDSDKASGSGENASIGKIVTLMSVDTERIRSYVCYAHRISIEVPISIILAISGLFMLVGWSAFAGLAVIAIITPLTSYIGSFVSKLQEAIMKNTDKRISLMNETLQGIRIIKYFAWEGEFMQKIMAAREAEIKSLIRLWCASIAFDMVGRGSGLFVSFVVFFFYTWIAGNHLGAAKAFTAITLLRIVGGLLSSLQQDIMLIYQAKVSLDRISRFLEEEELERFHLESVDEAELIFQASAPKSGDMVGFVDGEFSYTESSDDADFFQYKFVLRGLDFQFPVGKLSLITGPTGSGKSSLLLALLGELRTLSGDHYLPRSSGKSGDDVAYLAQTAWLLNATIRDNILFGSPFVQDKYDKVIAACALLPDLNAFGAGDLTEIGEKGINMSGGQKQRISLARAAYSTASTVLLDDPLSAVDAPTAKHLMRHCILDVMKDRTVILVSHAMGLVLPHAEYVVALRKGEVVARGPISELRTNPIIEAEIGDHEYHFEKEKPEVEKNRSSPLSPVIAMGTGDRLIEVEEKATGSVQFKVYKAYFKHAGGYLFLVSMALVFLLVYGVNFGQDWWLKIWTDHDVVSKQIVSQKYGTASASGSEHVTSAYSSFPALSSHLLSRVAAALSSATDSLITVPLPENENSGYLSPQQTLFYVGIYGLFGIAILIADAILTMAQLVCGMVASKRMHNALLASVLGSPLRFFEVTPLGRILNRFSKDIENLDSSVMNMVFLFVHKLMEGTKIVVTIGIAAPMFLMFVFPVVLIYLWISRYYLCASRELKRLEAITRSPVYSQFSETLVGVSTIRAYGAESRFTRTNEAKVDANLRPFFYLWVANRWLCVRTDIMSSLIVFGAGAAILTGSITAGWAGLCMTYALDFINVLTWAVRVHAEMEMSMNSVERVQEYSSLPQEPAAVIASYRPSPDWPARGEINVRNLSVRYAEGQPDVLCDVTFNVKGGEKVGIVGRTGAGKSTLSLAFFRIMPLAQGYIIIDGMDISKMGLHDLRSSLTIIPQDPVLFTGTLRSNLDPNHEHDDQTIWNALKRVHFLESMQPQSAEPASSAADSMTLFEGSGSTLDVFNQGESNNAELLVDRSGGSNLLDQHSQISLDQIVSENGSNFSQGQRQLLCLARALLRKSRVILLDEATASIDAATDEKIQITIREEFTACTVLCIAHRLRTVMDYDKILVLEKGRVVECGSPGSLLAQGPLSTFYTMCKETGELVNLMALCASYSQN